MHVPNRAQAAPETSPSPRPDHVTEMTLATLRDGYRAIVFGASGGIGQELTRAIARDPRCQQVYACARSPGPTSGKVNGIAFDLTDETSMARAIEVAAAERPLDLVIVATGVLHEGPIQPEKSWRALTGAGLEHAFQINAIGPALIAKHALPRLARDHKTVFAALSARVGSITDNRLGGWYGYRAAKAALNMLIRTSAIELARRNRAAVCVTLHPGTVDTGLSLPFQSGVPPQALFSPKQSAGYLMKVIDQLEPKDSGRLFAWDGTAIEF